jgi:phospholipase D1/2
VDAIEFRVKAAKRTGLLAAVSKVKHLSMHAVPATELIEKRVVEGWFPLSTYTAEHTVEGDSSDDEDGSGHTHRPHIHRHGSSGTGPQPDDGKDHPLGSLHLRLAFIPIGEGPEALGNIEAPESYFPARHGAKVALYQNADTPPGSAVTIPFRPDYVHGRCWRDIALGIVQATEFVYIAGWSVWTELKLIRTNFPGDLDIIPNDMTLGELLKWKAEQGVTVCVMVWDEVASMNLAGGLYKSAGLMGTHDEEVVRYFKHSKVHAIKATRTSSKKEKVATLRNEVLFTHHQKTVIFGRKDTRTGKARVEAFVGGLDLTNGRYDNPAHSLFRTLHNVNGPPDFYQACAPEITAGSGPREPWQDIHAHFTGNAAWDVLSNFEGRWVCQAPRSEYSALHPRPANLFVTPKEEDQILDGPWSIQILRSITAASTALDASRPGILLRQDVGIDRSIHYGYVHQIRRAKTFIYMENQYFIGSSHLWDSGQRGGFAANIVPIELAAKLCAKIRARERFAVYLTVPMYPEGPPASAAVQEILAFQRKTVSLIATRVAMAIKETGSDTQVSDWFNVFCLVNRESAEGGQGNGGTNAMETSLSASRRFMIYVHSKFACFDDTAVIVGSANINSYEIALFYLLNSCDFLVNC